MQEIRNEQRKEIEFEFGEPKGEGALRGHLLMEKKYE